MYSATIPLTVMITTYLAFFVLIVTGHIRDMIVKRFFPKDFKHLLSCDEKEPLYTAFESFFIRRLYTRICDCWNRPIVGVPGRIVTILMRKSNNENVSFVLTGKRVSALNVGSYNYLGLASSIEVQKHCIKRDINKHTTKVSSDRPKKIQSKESVGFDLRPKDFEIPEKDGNYPESIEKEFRDPHNISTQTLKCIGDVKPPAFAEYGNLDSNKDGDVHLPSKIQKTLQNIEFGSYSEKHSKDENMKKPKEKSELYSRFTIDEALFECPVNIPGTTRDVGQHKSILMLEKEISSFIGTESACVFPMGFGTNSCLLPFLAKNGVLVLSDEFNHASIVYGLRMGQGVIRTFKHNNPKDLEYVLRESIAYGQPETHRPWKAILVVVEGIYSMEGTIVCLPEILELKKKYKFFLFIDEAHSIGALGKTGRGVCEYFNISPKNIDVLMGTFTKTFGASGGYIAGSKSFVDNARTHSDMATCGEQMPPIVAAQVMGCIQKLKENPSMCEILAKNTVYFRSKLIERGFVLFGDKASPVIPLMIFNPAKIADFSRMCLERKVAVVVVGYPATPVISSRVRFCMSAALTKHDLDAIIRVVTFVGQYLGLNIVSRRSKRRR